MVCEYCHEDFATTAGYQAHHSSCFYKDNPKPKPEIKKEDEKQDEVKSTNSNKITAAKKKTTTRRNSRVTKK